MLIILIVHRRFSGWKRKLDVNESQIQMSHTESHLVNIFNQPNSNIYLRKTTQ